MAQTQKTHRQLLPRGLCPALLMKHILTHSLDDVVTDERQWPGDGYYWCSKTCTCVGPDDEVVHPKTCLPGRRCYDGPQS
ncbi:MAG: hypothetical protein IPK26_11525 [Planctomycetes bacterium]|nr:hypothetical protein [Planctomycetota bacterium]